MSLTRLKQLFDHARSRKRYARRRTGRFRPMDRQRVGVAADVVGHVMGRPRIDSRG